MTTPQERFPIAELSAVDVAFPATVKHLMPKYEDIPREFREWPSQNKWVRLFDDMFYHGLKSLKLTPKEGVDEKKALRHLRTIAGSFEPQHEHKTAAFAYLASQWFEDAAWERAAAKGEGK